MTKKFLAHCSLILMVGLFSCSGNQQSNKSDQANKRKQEPAKRVTEKDPTPNKKQQEDFDHKAGHFYKENPFPGSNLDLSLYLPKSYDSTEQHPIIFFFDAHARGYLPLKKYRDLADTFGYIFIGSQYFKNNLDRNKVNDHIDQLLNTAQKFLSIHDSMTYTGGFSGGARIASQVAFMQPVFDGVIAAGAGLQDQSAPNAQPLTYIGIAGLRDFNYLEVKQTYENFKQNHDNVYFFPFTGGHEWPPLEKLRKAMLVLTIQAHQKGYWDQKPLVSNQFDLLVQGFQEKLNQGQKIDAWQAGEDIITIFNSIKDVSIIEERVNQLKATEKVTSYQQQIDNVVQREDREKRKLYKAFEERSLHWWESEISSMQRTKNYGSRHVSNLNARLLNFISMMAYSNLEKAFSNKQFNQIPRLLKIYETADPENPDVYYFKAKHAALNNQSGQTLDHLKTAIKKGYDEPNKLKNDRLFRNLDGSNIQSLASQAKKNR